MIKRSRSEEKQQPPSAEHVSQRCRECIYAYPHAELCCEPRGDSRGKDTAFSQACATGPRCSRNPSSCSDSSRKRAGVSGSRAPASVHVCARCRAPGHHRHRLRGRLAKSTRRVSPQNSLKSFLLQGKEKVRRQTTEGEDLPEPHAASSSCRLNLPHHLLFFFFTPPTRKLRGPRGGEQTCSATAIRTTQVSSHAELLLPASP